MKNLFRTIIIITFGWLLIITPLFFAVYAFSTQPDKFKTIVASSGMYETAIPAVIETSLKKAETEEAKALLQNPAIQQIANNTLSPTVVQSASEQVIDGTYRWLVGETARPEFTIDLTTQREQLAADLDAYALSYVEALPICTPQQLAAYTTNTDVLGLQCRPGGVPPQQIIDDFGDQTLAESEILQNPVITANDIAGLSSISDEQSANVQEKFMALRSMVIALVCIAAALALGIFFMTPERGHALRLLGRMLIITGAVLSAMSFGTVYLIERSNTAAIGSAETAFRAAVADTAVNVANQLNRYILLWTVSYIIAGFIVYILGRRLYHRPNNVSQPQQPTPIP